jgi:hypothetical protein
MGQQGCYLNVGHQHLWVERDYLIFLRPDRPLGASRFVRFNGDETAFQTVMAEVTAIAAETVEGRRRDHGEGAAAVAKIAASADDLEAGIALSLLGRGADAQTRLNRRVHPAYADQAARYAAADSEAAATIARAAVESTRSKLKLVGHWADWGA